MIRKGQTQRDEDSMISKFASTEEIHVVVAGGLQGGSRSRVLEPRETERVALRDAPDGTNQLTFLKLHAILSAGSGTHGVR